MLELEGKDPLEEDDETENPHACTKLDGLAETLDTFGGPYVNAARPARDVSCRPLESSLREDQCTA
jgi:hypothetical protein